MSPLMHISDAIADWLDQYPGSQEDAEDLGLPDPATLPVCDPSCDPWLHATPDPCPLCDTHPCRHAA